MRYLLNSIFLLAPLFLLTGSTNMQAMDHMLESDEQAIKQEERNKMFTSAVVRLLRQDVLSRNGYSQHYAYESVSTLRNLLEQGAEVDAPFAENRTALIEVCDTSPTDFERIGVSQKALVALLLEFKANASHRDAYGKAPVEYAASYNNVDALQELVRSHANLMGTPHITGCHLSAYFRAHEALKLLIAHGVPLNTIAYTGRAPIHYALDTDWDTTTLSLLLDGGANLETLTQEDQRDNSEYEIYHHPRRIKNDIGVGSSPFHMAAQSYTGIKNGVDLFAREMIVHAKKLLLYHALFHGTTDCKSIFTFLCCIRRLSPELYGDRNKLVIPHCHMQPKLLRQILHANDNNTITAGVQALVIRTKKLQQILLIRNANYKTAHDIELTSIPVDVEIEGTVLLKPETLENDCAAFIHAEREDAVAQLPGTNPFKAAWSLVMSPEAPEVLITQDAPEEPLAAENAPTTQVARSLGTPAAMCCVIC
ncbi:MAG: ankyrin repeat domain-containing protein [Candidatus Babeliales bacterium]